MAFRTIADIKRANKELGHHWFSPDTMRFFSSRVLREVYGGRYFVTSEQFYPVLGEAYARRYTIRVAADDGSIDTVGEFQAYKTARAAKAAARKLGAQEG